MAQSRLHGVSPLIEIISPQDIEKVKAVMAEKYGDLSIPENYHKFVAAIIDFVNEFAELNRENVAQKALRIARKALSETAQRAGTQYDWNADPDKMTLLQGEAFAKIDEFLARGGADVQGK